MWIKWMPLRYFLSFLLAIILPPIIYSLCVAISPFYLLFTIFYKVPKKMFKCIKYELKGFIRLTTFIFMIIILTIPLAILWFTLIITISTILLVLYYPFIIILMLIMFFRHCNISPKSKQKLSSEQQ